MKTIANVMCVLNEAEFIEAAIRSVLPGVDQMIVIDQGSTDGTQEILDRLDVMWVSTRGQNYLTRGEKFFRNLGINLCFCDWFMRTDGDEIMGDGWEKEVRNFIENAGDLYGAIRGNYWQLVGTSEFCTPDSPLTPEGGCQPFLMRMHDGLRVGEPMAGTKVHTPVINFSPPQVANLSGVYIFHCGYAKKDLTARFNRNIERGDWTQDERHKAEFFKSAKNEPLALLHDCVPLTIPRERLPASIREPKFVCDYDPATRRITGRRPVSV